MSRFIVTIIFLTYVFPGSFLLGEKGYGITGLYSPKAGIFGFNLITFHPKSIGLITEFKGLLSNPVNNVSNESYASVSVGFTKPINETTIAYIAPTVYWRMYESIRNGASMVETDKMGYDLSLGAMVINHKAPLKYFTYQVGWSIARIGLTLGVGLRLDGIFGRMLK